MSNNYSNHASDGLINYMHSICPLNAKWVYPNISENKIHKLKRHFRVNAFFYLISPMLIYLMARESSAEERSLTIVVSMAIFLSAIVLMLRRDLQNTRIAIGTVTDVSSWTSVYTKSVSIRRFVEFKSNQNVYRYYCSSIEFFNPSDKYFLELNAKNTVVGYRFIADANDLNFVFPNGCE